MLIYRHWAFVWLLCFGCSLKYCVCSESPHRDLRDHLMNNYGNVKIRPVHRASTSTNVTYRPIFINLVEMDTKNQQFSVTASVKEVWEDEFLTWRPSDYDNIETIFLDSDDIWLPDIVMSNNPKFPDYQPDTKVEVTSDGTVYWYYQATFHSHCAVNVKWFPFDTQICNIKFESWIYNGKELNLFIENSEDSLQTRYLANGVWDLCDVSVKKVDKHYACCPEPFYSLDYRLVFHRQAHFYITYIIVPVILLFALSVSIFLLPADLSVKLQFSITNLLAVALFEKLVAEVIPPTAHNSPVIDTYFVTIIISVSLSVMANVLVMNVSNRTREKPSDWMKYLFLEDVPKMFCKAWPTPRELEEKNDQHQTISPSYKGGKYDVCYDNPCFGNHNNPVPLSMTPQGCQNGVVVPNKDDTQETKQDFTKEWKQIGHVLTRFFGVVFGLNMAISTFLILLLIWFSSESDYEYALGPGRDVWLNKTSYWV